MHVPSVFSQNFKTIFLLTFNCFQLLCVSLTRQCTQNEMETKIFCTFKNRVLQYIMVLMVGAQCISIYTLAGPSAYA